MLMIENNPELDTLVEIHGDLQAANGVHTGILAVVLAKLEEYLAIRGEDPSSNNSQSKPLKCDDLR